MKLWFYALEGSTVGPIREDELRAMFREGRLRPDTLVWTEGYGDAWQPASATAVIAATALQPPPLPVAPVALPPSPAISIADPARNLVTPSASAPLKHSAYAWLIGVSPLIIAALDIVLVAASVDAGEPPVSSGVTIWSGILMLLAAWKDAQAIERAGLNPAKRTLVPFMLLSPVGYFLRRRHVAGLSLTPLWLWLPCGVAFLIIEVALFA